MAPVSHCLFISLFVVETFDTLNVLSEDFSLTFEGVQQHLLPNVLIHLPLTCKAGVISLQKHINTHTHLVITVSGLSDECVCGRVCDHRCVRPIGIVEGEVLGSIFGLFRVGDT